MASSTLFPSLQSKYAIDASGEEGSPVPMSAYERSVIEWCNSAYEEAEYDQAQSEDLRLVPKFIDYISGKQWKTGQRASYKSTPVNNKSFQLYKELLSQLTDISPSIQVGCTDSDEAAQQTKNVLNNGLDSWSIDSDWDLKLAQTISYGILTTGFGKLQFNPELNFGEGELELIPIAPDKLLPIKPRDTLQSGEGVIYHDYLPLRWFHNRYKKGRMVRPDSAISQWHRKPGSPAHIPTQLFEMLSPAMQRTLGGAGKIQSSAVPMAMLREFWIKDDSENESRQMLRVGEEGKNWSYLVKPGGKLYPRGRLIVLGGDVILHDGPNPYWHGLFPFEMLRLNVVPWNFYGLSDMRSWVDLQDLINQILAGVIDVVKKATNPAFYAPKNAFSEAVWSTLDFGMPGARAAYSPSAAHEPKFAPPPQLPGFVLPLYQGLERTLDQFGVGGMMSEAARKKQIPGADAIDAIKQEKTTPIRMQSRNIEIFIRDLGKQQVSNFFQFWTAKKRMQRLGATKGLTFEDFDWDPQKMLPAEFKDNPMEHIRKYKMLIEPGSLLKIAKTEKRMELLKLRLMGDLSRKQLFKHGGININYDENETELKAEIPPMPKKKGKH